MSWNNIIGFFESTWQRIDGQIDIRGIIADSGFYLREFIELLERRGLIYIIAARPYCPSNRAKRVARPPYEALEVGLSLKDLSEMISIQYR